MRDGRRIAFMGPEIFGVALALASIGKDKITVTHIPWISATDDPIGQRTSIHQT
jgi:hypothetical protein